MIYNGLETCILNSGSYDDESGASGGNGWWTDSFDEDDSTSSSSTTTNPFGSFSSLWTFIKKDDGQDEWAHTAMPPEKHNEKQEDNILTRLSDTETMKEKFAKLLLGEDLTGGARGLSSALALSNAITNLAVDHSVFQSGKANLGDKLHKILSVESLSPEEMVNCVNPKSEHNALESINRLEAAILAWKEKTAEHDNDKTPLRTSWSFVKDSHSKLDRLELLLNRAELLVHQLKIKYPNLPRTFLDVTKIQYGKDVGCSILEAYSRVLSNLAYRILSRIGDILQEDVTSSPNSPTAMSQLMGAKIPGILDSPMLDRVRHSLKHQLNWSQVGKEACHSLSPR